MRTYKERYVLVLIILKICSFLLLFGLIFMIVQSVLIPKRFPYTNSYEYGKLKYFCNEDKDSIDVLICGASHAGRGILPMELYEACGVKAYNLSTSSQGLDLSYYLLKEALKTQKPELIVIDVSSLYFGKQESITWKFIMDEMPFGRNKISIAQEYLKQYPDLQESVSNIVFPILSYHTRWKELSKKDFDVFVRNKQYFGKGGNLISFIASGISVDEMNAVTEGLIQNTEKVLYEYIDGDFSDRYEENTIYDPSLPQGNVEWFLKIKQLCDEHEISLLATKIPAVNYPQIYGSSWTKERYDRVFSLCAEYGIDYYDLLYETDIGLDVGKDSQDSGAHLNLRGACKTSADIGNYMKEHYKLSSERTMKWDRDLISYQKVRKMALLELEQDFLTYINILTNEYQDKMIFIAASDDMSRGFNPADIEALRALGLQTDFSNAVQNAYIAVIDNGKVTYEALSNRPLHHNGTVGSELFYDLYSSGWWTNSGVAITINGAGYAVGGRGLNIVVYDDERNLVLDSVCFDTSAEYHTPIRNNGMINSFEEAFEYYIMEVEDK